MTRRAFRERLVVPPLLGGALSACPEPQTCAARGDATPIDGVASYAIGSAPGASVTSTVTIDDYTEQCSYPGEEFPMTIGGCTLWVTLQQGPEPPSRDFPGNPDAYGTIEAGQTCALSLASGTASVDVTDGTVSFAEDATGVFLSGTVTKWNDGSGPTGTIAWQLLGSGWPAGG